MPNIDSSNAPIQQSKTTQETVINAVQVSLLLSEIAYDEDATPEDLQNLTVALDEVGEAQDRHRSGR